MIGTLEERVGGQLVVGVPGTRLTPSLLEHLRAVHAGGLIPFARNFEAPEQFHEWMLVLRQEFGCSPLVMIDHEGGRIVRLAAGVTRFPDAQTIGRTQQPEAVYRQGVVEAEELSSYGIQVNLAPCVDVLVEGADPVIGDRSYGSDARLVAEMATARIRGMQERGLHACAKHFPGIGAVPRDPHKQLPTVRLSWATVRDTHLAPFRAAIRAGVSCVMSSHVCYEQIAGLQGQPATFSSWCIRTLLREELGFQGVVVSDDLEMGALRELCPIGEAAVRALEAGHDLLLVCSDPALHREVFEALCHAYRSGRLPISELDRSLARIERLRRKFSPGP